MNLELTIAQVFKFLLRPIESPSYQKNSPGTDFKPSSFNNTSISQSEFTLESFS